MINKIICTGLFISCSWKLHAQAAGNYMYAAPPAADAFYEESSDKGSRSYKTSSPATSPAYYYTSPLEANAVIINDSVIELGVKALINVKADSYVAIFGVSQVAESIDSCNRLINERINGFISRLAGLGIKRSDIHIDFISQVPVFEYELEKKLFSKKYNEIPKGFELKKNVHVGYSKGEILDEMLVAAAKNEIYDVVKVDYIINNVESIYDSLRTASIKTLNRKTEEMKKLGIKFGAKFEVVAEETRCFYPIDRYKSYTAFNNVSLPTAKKGTSGYGQYQSPKTLSLYYDKLSYGNFEIVINPKLIEPSAQFTYNLKIRYTFKTELIPKEKQITTPAGVPK